MSKIIALLSFLLLPLSVLGQTQHAHDDGRDDGHDDRRHDHIPLSPIGMMADHTHQAGQWMFRVRTMQMTMEDLRDGTNDLSNADVLNDFMVTPTRMTTDMHMLGLMFAPTEDITLMAMLPYMTKDMDHRTRMGGTFNTRSSGWGDLGLNALFNLSNDHQQTFVAQLGFSIPTGSITATDATPMGQARLPYPMQLGTGTVDMTLGLSAAWRNNNWHWGTQTRATLRTGKNDEGYRIGNQLESNLWLTHAGWSKWYPSARLSLVKRNNIIGEDDSLNPNFVPTADPERQGRLQANIGIGLQADISHKHRLALEWLTPVYQNLDGPQLKMDQSLQLGWTYLP